MKKQINNLFYQHTTYMNYHLVLQRFASMKVLLLLCFIVVCQASSWSGNEGGACILNTATQPDKNLEKKHLDPTCNSEADAIAYSVEVNTHLTQCVKSHIFVQKLNFV